MTRDWVIALVIVVLAAWQGANQGSAFAEEPPPHPSTVASKVDAESEKSVPPDAAVITINGLCEKSVAADHAAASNCKTAITRGEFERLVDIIQPNMPSLTRNKFAIRYAAALVMSQKAHQLGLDQGRNYEQRLELARIQLLSQMFNEDLQEKANRISDKEVEEYYNNNKIAFSEADLQRIFVPRSGEVLPFNKKRYTNAPTKPQDAQAMMKKEAQQLRVRAAAGADFGKLQEEAIKFAGLTTKPPDTNMSKTRRIGLPPAQAAVMDLKPGEVSEVIANNSGYLIYKLLKTETLPLEKVREEIRQTMRTARLKDAMESLRQSATTQLNEDYFKPPDIQFPAGAIGQATTPPSPESNY